ncbi:hypothetical protein [Fischerella sp. PCC 9605]|nr:hypothetical protein [Fischerella sp. PCC 9605]
MLYCFGKSDRSSYWEALQSKRPLAGESSRRPAKKSSEAKQAGYPRS